MNERIQLLAVQAEIYAGDLIDQGADYNQYPRYYTEKFAELIVKECAEVAANVVAEHEGVDFGLVEACYKHFGVRE
jgi:hypothetical protein